MKQPVCPYCGTVLELSVSCVTEWKRKINKDGSVGKKIIKSKGSNVFDATFLICPECPFEYDVEHCSDSKTYKELDEWISENLEELNDWK